MEHINERTQSFLLRRPVCNICTSTSTHLHSSHLQHLQLLRLLLQHLQGSHLSLEQGGGISNLNINQQNHSSFIVDNIDLQKEVMH